MIACSVDTNTSSDVFQCGKKYSLAKTVMLLVSLTLSTAFQNSVISEFPAMSVCTAWLKGQGTEWHFAVLKCTVQSIAKQHFFGELCRLSGLFMTAL